VPGRTSSRERTGAATNRAWRPPVPSPRGAGRGVGERGRDPGRKHLHPDGREHTPPIPRFARVQALWRRPSPLVRLPLRCAKGPPHSAPLPVCRRGEGTGGAPRSIRSQPVLRACSPLSPRTASATGNRQPATGNRQPVTGNWQPCLAPRSASSTVHRQPDSREAVSPQPAPRKPQPPRGASSTVTVPTGHRPPATLHREPRNRISPVAMLTENGTQTRGDG